MSDHFSPVAGQYARARPTYPTELFDWLAAQCPTHDMAWDVGAGSGQASLWLATHFAKVTASDISAEQLSQAPANPRITYRTSEAHDSGLPDSSVDLVTVAQALHWFDLERFYAEVKRVAKPGAMIAVWSYGMIATDDTAINAAMDHLYSDIVGPYWPPERRDVENGYANLAFPFEAVEVSPFALQAEWDLPRLLGYFRSWSATARMQKATGVNPIDAYASRLHDVWGEAERTRRISWPLAMRVGRIW